MEETTKNNTATHTTAPNSRSRQGAALMKTSCSHSQNHNPQGGILSSLTCWVVEPRGITQTMKIPKHGHLGGNEETYDLSMIIIFL